MASDSVDESAGSVSVNFTVIGTASEIDLLVPFSIAPPAGTAGMWPACIVNLMLQTIIIVVRLPILPI